MNGSGLGSVVEQWDLEVQMHSSLKVASRVERVVKMTFGKLVFNSQDIEHEN